MLVEVIVGGFGAGAVVRLNCIVEDILLLPVTRRVNRAVVAAIGVPLIVPLALRVIPVGKVPDTTVHVYGTVPPVAIKV